MKRYSITKYFFNEQNLDDDWISIYDIGKEYNGKILDIEQYMKVEDAYVNAIMEICRYMNLDYFRIKNVFRWRTLNEVNEEIEQSNFQSVYSESMLKTYETVADDSILTYNELEDLIRLELREDIGGLLYVPYRLKIFIGYDYMMGVHSSISLNDLYEKIKSTGLNIFQF